MAAITSRSKRDFSFGNSGLESLGPGTYNPKGPSSIKVTHSQAPFSSTTGRDGPTSKSDMVVPGPGYYLDQGSKDTNLKASSIFASKSSRLSSDKDLPKQALMPGPGSYSTPGNTWLKSAPSYPSPPTEPKPINWVKVSTAPSIPASSQSYGYEEGPKGELVQQKPPNLGFTGRAMVDSAGPGQYDPDVGLTKKSTTVGPAFGQQKGRRFNPPAKETRPGPGAYDLSAAVGPTDEEERARPSGVFLSSTSRAKLRFSEAKDTPGPGSYRPKDPWAKPADIERNPNVPEHTQAFGSTSKKPFHAASEQHPVRLNNPHIPGPGTYDAAGTFEKMAKQKAIAAKEQAPGHGAFQSSAGRFTESKATTKATPGPGYYAAASDSLASSVQRKIVGRYGVFGTTSQRFPAHKTEEAAGPGAYLSEVTEQGPRKRDKRQSVFASKTGRGEDAKKLQKKKAQDAPAVGAYDVPGPDWIKKSGSCARDSMAHAPRFVDKKEVGPIPGPGYYESTQNTLSNKNLGGDAVLVRGELRRATFRGLDRAGSQKPNLDRTSRFKSDPASNQPGPGWYSTDNSMVKKTFNITVGQNGW